MGWQEGLGIHTQIDPADSRARGQTTDLGRRPVRERKDFISKAKSNACHETSSKADESSVPDLRHRYYVPTSCYNQSLATTTAKAAKPSANQQYTVSAERSRARRLG